MPVEELTDLRTLVRDYLREKISIQVNNFRAAGGGVINTNDDFTFDVTVSNANRSDGGIVLTNVHYVVAIEGLSRLRTPELRSGESVTAHLGEPNEVVLDPDDPPVLTRSFSFAPVGVPSGLNPTDTDDLTFTGRARGTGVGTVSVHIDAEPVLSDLFPRRDSPDVNAGFNIIPV